MEYFKGSPELPLEIIAHVFSFLSDLKKIEFVGANKKIYEACPITLRKKYFPDGYGEKFNNCIVKIRFTYLNSAITYTGLQKIRVNLLSINNLIVFPERLRVLKIRKVTCSEKTYIKLPGSVRTFKLTVNNCGYFPFILNEGLVKFTAPEDTQMFGSVALNTHVELSELRVS